MKSAIARSLLGLYYRPGKVYTVPFGPLRGAKLWYDRSVTYHAVLGLWEPGTFRILSRMLAFLKETRPRVVACDLGANIGLVTVWFSRQLGESGTVYSFEPSPSVLPILKNNLRVNNTKNVTLVEAACSGTTGTIDFFLGDNHHTSSLQPNRAGGGQTDLERVTVPTTSLDDYFYQEGRHPPDLIKMDIEGGGTLALPACQRCVTDRRPLILVESHSPEEDRAISDLILANDYHAFRVNNWQWVEQPGQTYPDPKGIWGTTFLCPSEHKAYFSEKLASK